MEIGERYKHSKRGTTYQIKEFTIDADSLKMRASYVCEQTGEVWSRLVEQFDQDVEVNGQIVKRFVKL